ncbi:type I-E CRISPR-associated protein Cas7/Cse4/CasC [Butyricicoccus sp.]|uniref:type I-E CRISPR-associated protein Cas7/Cse4/CasC n=1 Tax=Butyricicoccus sp. TaxID=2049021 RepID=UPI003D7C443A
MLIEVHMLKNYPATNLNRDETGSPKTCLFGGYTRGRISSQCLKRNWRKSEQFCQAIGEENLGIRTRKFPQLVCEALAEKGVSEDVLKEVQPKLSGFGNKEGKENKDGSTTAQVMFFAPQDIESVAVKIKEILDDCADIKAVKKLKAKDLQAAVKDANVRPVTLDIALFGRMVTSNAFRDVEASMQVAHAVSTNKVALESDYFTAMDDLLSGDTMEESGSAMIGDTDYNSSCYYIYASIDTDALKENLKYADNAEKLIQKAIPALLRAMAMTNPSGKQNSFAGHTLPSAMMVEVKQDKIPVNLVNAFVEPVRPTIKADLVKNSIQRLADETDTLVNDFGLAVDKRLWFCSSKYDVKPKCEAEQCKNFQALLEQVTELLK